MLYVISGTDFIKRRAKLGNLIDYALSKKPGALVKRITPGNASAENISSVIEEHTLSQGLFEHRLVVILEDFLADEEVRDITLKYLKQIKESENIFIIYERDIPERIAKKIGTFAEKTQVFEGQKAPVARFNIFNLADALGRRDKLGAWVELLKAFKEGSLPEEVHGTLFWQVKSMLMVKEGGESAETLGIKPFTYSKSKTFSKNYSLEELKHLSRELVTLYHDSHRGLDSLDLGLERILLTTL